MSSDPESIISIQKRLLSKINICNQLKRENSRLSTDLSRFKLLATNFKNHFNQIHDKYSAIFDLLNLDQLENQFNVFNEIDSKVCFVLCKNLNENQTNSLVTKSHLIGKQFNEISTQTDVREGNSCPVIVDDSVIQQKVFKESNSQTIIQTNEVSTQTDCQQITDNLNAEEIPDNESDGIDCDNNLMDDSDNETIIGNDDQNVETNSENRVVMASDDSTTDSEMNVDLNEKPNKRTNKRNLRKRVIKTQIKSNKNKFNEKTELNNKSDVKLYKCLINECYKTFGKEDNLGEHQLRVHPQEFDDKPWYECPDVVCNYKTKSTKALSEHRPIHLRRFVCSDCEKRFSARKDLNRHLATHKSILKTIQCEWYGCERMFANNHEMKHHMNIHTLEKRWRCEWPACGLLFNSRLSYKKHMKSKHTGPFFNCSKCQFQTSVKTTLDNHMRKHSKYDFKDGKLSCSWPGCEADFTKKSSYVIHVARHQGKFSYKCKHCDYITQNTVRLKSHSKIHEKQSNV